jgi:hypothetical protein
MTDDGWTWMNCDRPLRVQWPSSFPLELLPTDDDVQDSKTVIALLSNVRTAHNDLILPI